MTGSRDGEACAKVELHKKFKMDFQKADSNQPGERIQFAHSDLSICLCHRFSYTHRTSTSRQSHNGVFRYKVYEDLARGNSIGSQTKSLRTRAVKVSI